MDPGNGLLSNATAPALSAPDMPAADEQAVASRAVLTQILLLAAALVLGQYMNLKKITIVGDSAVALLLGLTAGMLCYFANFSDTYLAWLGFSKEFFFYGLLPPIIFEAGYSLETKPFVRNLGAICAYAFVGTFISTVLIGATMWLGGLLHICYRLTLVQALLYGAIISATDPVTVLSVFQRLNAHPDLYALVFGESVLNDAVAITLYKTFLGFLNKPVTFRAIGFGLRTFFWSFIGSTAIGAAVGLASSLLFKTKLLRTDDRHSPLEANIVILFAFASYFIADGLGESGIVAVLFCGLTMANYTRRNLSQYAQETSMAFFRTWATMAETFVFVYIGASVSLQTAAWGHGLTWGFLVVALIAIAHSRAANIWACSKAVGLLRPPDMKIPHAHQTMLWWSGLRGAIAFALSLSAVQDIPGGAGDVMLTCTFVIILITVLVNGGGCAALLQKLRLKASDDVRQPYLPVSTSTDNNSNSTGDAAVRQSAFSLNDEDASARGGHGSDDERSRGGMVGLPSGGVASLGLYEVQLQPQNDTPIGGNGGSSPGPVDRMLGTQGADAMLHNGLETVRRFNRAGIQGTLTDIDEKFMQPFFVAASPRGSPTAGGQQSGMTDMSTPQSERQENPPQIANTAGVGSAQSPSVWQHQQQQPGDSNQHFQHQQQHQWQPQHLQRRSSLHDDESPPTPPYLRPLSANTAFEARRRSVTDSGDTSAVPLTPYDREPSETAPIRASSSGSTGIAASQPPPRRTTAALQSFQTRLAAVLKPNGSGVSSAARSGTGRMKQSPEPRREDRTR